MNKSLIVLFVMMVNIVFIILVMGCSDTNGQNNGHHYDYQIYTHSDKICMENHLYGRIACGAVPLFDDDGKPRKCKMEW